MSHAAGIFYFLPKEKENIRSEGGNLPRNGGGGSSRRKGLSLQTGRRNMRGKGLR